MSFCSSCGHQLDESAKFCPECGKGIDATVKIEKIEAKPKDRLSTTPRQREERPERQEEPKKDSLEGRDWDRPKQRRPEREPRQSGGGFATASLVCAIVGWIINPILVLGFVFGIIGLTGHRPGRGRAIAGLIISILGIIAWVASIIYLASIGWKWFGD